MVRAARLAVWAVPVLAILTPVPAHAQAQPGAEHFSVLVLPVSTPGPGLRPLAAVVQDAVAQGLRQYGAAGQVAVAFRRDDPAVQRALREHPYLELPPDGQVSPALADALAWVLGMDTGVSGRLEADDSTARVVLRASSARSRTVREYTSAASLPADVRSALSPEATARWAQALVEPSARALAADLPALAAAQPADPEEHVREGERHLAQGEYAQAIIEYDLASAARPDDPVLYLALARAYRGVGDLHAALLEARRALRLHPGLVAAQVLLGRVYAEMGRLEPALQAFQQAALAEPQSTDALQGLAEVYAAQGQPAMALVQYERLLALNPKDLDALLAAGAAAEQAGRWTEADDYYRRAAALDPERVDVWQRRIDLHASRGERAEALAVLKEAEDAGAPIRYEDAQFVGMARLMEAEAADIVAAAKARTEDAAAQAPGVTEVGALWGRSDTLALAAQGLVAPEPLVVGHRHRVLALHQLNESTYELLRYAQTRERERLSRSRLLRDAAEQELTRARELDADAGWPIVTAEEPGGAAGTPAP